MARTLSQNPKAVKKREERLHWTPEQYAAAALAKKEYYERNPDKAAIQRARRKTYYLEHPDLVAVRHAASSRNRRAQGERSWHDWFKMMLQVKKGSKHGIAGDVTPEWCCELLMRQGTRCALTGMIVTHLHGDPCAASLDRIDSSLGYARNNSQITTVWANLAKNGFSQTVMQGVFLEFKAQGQPRECHSEAAA
jgi:hypothetical protein